MPLRKAAKTLSNIGLRGRLVRAGTPAGARPGSIVHVGRRKVENSALSVLHVRDGHLTEQVDTTVADCFDLISGEGTTWVDLHGLHDVDRLDRIGERLGIHPLVREDIANTGQRAKVEEYAGYLYIVVRQLQYDASTGQVDDEQVSIILTPQYVFTFQERPGDVFEPVRERLRQGRGTIRERGPDYLAYALIDSVVDHYFQVLEAVGDTVDELEQAVLEQEDPNIVRRIYALKREMLLVRRAVWPLREVMSQLTRVENSLIEDDTRVFLRDVHDHAVQVIDTAESLRDVLSSTMDLHLSMVSNRMNEVMKVLTIMSTIFIPLGFMAGLYGMNFAWMPELQWQWGYPTLLGTMALAVVGMLIFFRRRGWL